MGLRREWEDVGGKGLLRRAPCRFLHIVLMPNISGLGLDDGVGQASARTYRLRRLVGILRLKHSHQQM